MSDPTPGDNIITVRDRLILETNALIAQLQAIQGTPVTDLSDITDALFTQTNPRIPYLLQIDSRITDLQDQVLKLQAGIGAVPYNDLELGSVRGLLNAILSGINTLTQGQSPIINDTDKQSVGYEYDLGKNWARWIDVPGDLVVGETRIDVQAPTGWSGYSVYVQTTAPTIYLNTATDVPNTWLPLVGVAGSFYRFGVDAGYPIRAWLRRSATAGIVFNSQVVTRTWNGIPFHAIVWPSSYGALTYANPSAVMDKAIYWPHSPVGMMFDIISGSGIYSERISGATFVGTEAVVSGAPLTQSSSYTQIYSEAGPFAVRWTNPSGV